MDSRALDRRLDWLALRMHYIACPALMVVFGLMVEALHG